MDQLLREIVRCTHCAAALPCGPRPVVQLGAGARIVLISQAPGRMVHESGVPWNDASGARLRDWLALSAGVFYDPQQVALVPMGFCYPGRGESGDLPPRPECARLWQSRVMAKLPARAITLLIGRYAQEHYLPRASRWSVTERVRAFDKLADGVVALPHPSWRVVGWMKRNPWFAEEIIPALRRRVSYALATPACLSTPVA